MQRGGGGGREEADRETKRKGACVAEGRARGTNVAIIIDMLACKRCLLYVCQSAVVVAAFQGRSTFSRYPDDRVGGWGSRRYRDRRRSPPGCYVTTVSEVIGGYCSYLKVLQKTARAEGCEASEQPENVE
ncbi:hypothetical protein KM043_018012 [Ampulex compressa]|nr:hypothetical protein KM043_018012 [Ampulex compressa]